MIDCMAMQNNIERIRQMLAVETNVFPYVRRRFSFRQYSLFDFADSGYVKKLLAVLPDMAFLLMDGNVIEPSSPYLMDRDEMCIRDSRYPSRSEP